MRFSYDSSPDAMKKFFVDAYREHGPMVYLSWARATPEQRSRIARAMNLAAGEVFGKDADISNAWLSPSGIRKVKRANFGRGVSALVSENPTDDEIRGAAALARAQRARRAR